MPDSLYIQRAKNQRIRITSSSAILKLVGGVPRPLERQQWILEFPKISSQFVWLKLSGVLVYVLYYYEVAIATLRGLSEPKSRTRRNKNNLGMMARGTDHGYPSHSPQQPCF